MVDDAELRIVPNAITWVAPSPDPFAFYAESCSSCVYLHDDRPEVEDHIRMPLCRCNPVQGSGDQRNAAIGYPRVERHSPACGQWQRNPFLEDNSSE